MTCCASFVPDLPVDTVLDVFGDYFLYYVVAHGYDKMLKTLGDTFESFIQNLDSLHSMLALTYTQLRPPSFRSVLREIRDKQFSQT